MISFQIGSFFPSCALDMGVIKIQGLLQTYCTVKGSDEFIYCILYCRSSGDLAVPADGRPQSLPTCYHDGRVTLTLSSVIIHATVFPVMSSLYMYIAS